MRKKRIDHNAKFMYGIMAMAVVVLAVVALFMVWSFQKLKQEIPVQKEVCHITLTTGFCGDSLRVYVDDSIVYENKVETDSVSFQIVGNAEEDRFLMVELPHTDVAYSFNLPKGTRRVGLSFDGNEVKME